MDIVTKLLRKDKKDRLGSRGGDSFEILNHPFFSKLDLKAIFE